MLSGLRVVGHTPTEVRNDTLEFVDIAFNQAVDKTTFKVEDVAIRGPGIDVQPQTIEQLASDSFRVRFDALTVRGSYELQVGPNILDQTGDALDQNNNGTGGEIDDVYEAEFTYIVASVVFSTPATIADGDSTFDGEDILIDATTVTINGAHSFNSVHLVDGGVLTHSAATDSDEFKLDLDVAADVVIDDSSGISVNGKGYLSGRTLGNTTVGGVQGFAGGSYGGLGGVWERGDIPNAVYGDYANPNELGRGGPHTQSTGGGLVRLDADGRLQLDGWIEANGTSSEKRKATCSPSAVLQTPTETTRGR